MLAEQRHYDHPQLTEKEIEHDVANAPAARFSGEKRHPGGARRRKVVGLCWCVFFNPGTGLEAEVAEVYVDPGFRSQGIGGSCCARRATVSSAERHLRRRVDAREQSAGGAPLRGGRIRRTEQLVLTWLPLPGR